MIVVKNLFTGMCISFCCVHQNRVVMVIGIIAAFLFFFPISNEKELA